MADILIGLQYGDEGKGKITDLLSEEADLVVRFQGGANAGHTIIVGDQTFKLHLIPSGIVQDKMCLIGNGCVVDLDKLISEIKALEKIGKPIEFIFLSDLAHVVLPIHKRLDSHQEGARLNKIGTTQRGIGPTYEAKAARRGIRVKDCEHFSTLRDILKDLCGGSMDSLEIDEVAIRMSAAYAILEEHIINGVELLQDFIENDKKILLEGAQGTLLDVDFGTYPYVTSSNCIAGAACTGAGLSPLHVKNIIGVFKAYTTRVGEGPFLTELLDSIGEKIRTQGHEFGTTTGRPRRTGWIDLPSLRYAVALNGCNKLVMTKLDVLTGLDEVCICVDHGVGDQLMQYYSIPGWTEDITGVTKFEDLPENARYFVEFVEHALGQKMYMIGTGSNRNDIIRR